MFHHQGLVEVHSLETLPINSLLNISIYEHIIIYGLLLQLLLNRKRPFALENMNEKRRVPLPPQKVAVLIENSLVLI